MTALNVASRQGLSQSGDSETLVEVAGVEPVGVGESTPVNKRDEELSPEALTHILMQIPDQDPRLRTFPHMSFRGLPVTGSILGTLGLSNTGRRMV